MEDFIASSVRASLGFFHGRRTPDYGLATARVGGLIDYVNVSTLVGMIVSSRLATLSDMQTAYGLEDAYDLAEVISIDVHNRIEAAKNRVKHN